MHGGSRCRPLNVPGGCGSTGSVQAGHTKRTFLLASLGLSHQVDGTSHSLRVTGGIAGCRGQGLGTKLMKALVDRAGSVPVYLTTLRNTIPFYAQAGFHEVPLSQAPRSIRYMGLLSLVADKRLPGRPGPCLATHSLLRIASAPEISRKRGKESCMQVAG